MKTTIKKAVTKDISVEEVSKIIVEQYFPDLECYDTKEDFIWYVRDELEQYNPTEEEIESVCKIVVPLLIKKQDEYFQSFRQEELDLLSDRKSIIEWIKSVNSVGDVGFILTPEEILDEILKNGTKDRS